MIVNEDEVSAKMTRVARQDPNLMQGEDPSTEDPRDALSWIKVYEQLIQFKERLIGQVDTELSRAVPPLRDAVRDDVVIIADQLQRYRERLEFWYARHYQLAGIGIDHETRTLSHAGKSVQLTGREHQLFNVLLEDPEQFHPARKLLIDAWHDTDLSEDELRVYIASLRRKLKAIGLGRIVNRPSRGYALLFG